MTTVNVVVSTDGAGEAEHEGECSSGELHVDVCGRGLERESLCSERQVNESQGQRNAACGW